MPAAARGSGIAVASQPHIQLEALHEVARAFAGGEFRARAVLVRACAAVAEGFGFERVGIVRYVPETSMLVPFAGHGLSPSEIGALPTVLSMSRFDAFRRALASGRAIFVAEPQPGAVPDEIVRGFGIGSFVIVPLVENLLDLSRLEADSIRISPTRIHVAERLGALTDAAAGDGVTVDAPDDLYAVVDEDAFDRIVSNLLSNALRHGAPPIVVSATR